MILQALVNYYEKLADRGEIAKPGWGKAKVSYGLRISLDGELLGIIPLKTEEQRGKKNVWVPQMITVPEPVTRSSGVMANFLCDNSGYLLGIDEKGKPERSLQCFQEAKRKHLEILNDCKSESAQAVKAFFEKWEPESAREHEKLQDDLEEILSGVNLIFQYRGKYVQEDKEIMDAWEEYYENGSGENEGICLVTGEKTHISRIHTTIKGIPGAQSSGAALVSFNAPAFESYGKEQSYNAPVGEKAMYAYTAALNYLVSNKKYRTLLGDTMIVYWADSGEEEYQDMFAKAMNPEPDIDVQKELDDFFKNLAKGVYADTNDAQKIISAEEHFYILGLAPNAARLAVRFFYQDSFENIMTHLKAHYDRMEIARPLWDAQKYMGIYWMLQETVNKKSKDKKPIPNMAASVYRSILSGERYPESLYHAVFGRIKAEQDDTERRIRKITPGRAAIIKAFLINNYKEEMSVEINENNRNVAYILGREFAVLEAIQEAANPGINATIKDRYFNSACATPATVFPILFRLKNSHIKKIANRGLAVNYEKLLGGLQARIPVSDEQNTAYPKRLSLEEQGMFILGYYHQNQKRYEKAAKEEN